MRFLFGKVVMSSWQMQVDGLPCSGDAAAGVGRERELKVGMLTPPRFNHTKTWVFPKIGGTPKSSILRGFSIINHPFWGTPIIGNTHMITPKIRFNKPGQLRRCQVWWDQDAVSILWKPWWKQCGSPQIWPISDRFIACIAISFGDNQPWRCFLQFEMPGFVVDLLLTMHKGAARLWDHGTRENHRGKDDVFTAHLKLEDIWS